MFRKKILLLSVLFCTIFFNLSFPIQTQVSKASGTISYVILSKSKVVLDIGDQIDLSAITSNAKLPTWKSNDSKIASVNSYGKITAKKAGIAIITAKIKDAEASCKVTVNETKITLDTGKAALERGDKLKLSASTSNKSKITWKSSKKSIAIVDDYGNITAVKPGQTIITAKADGSSATCTLIVKSPSIKLNKTTIQLYRGQTDILTATVSSNVKPVWKTNKKSVALVDQNGTVTAVKNGVATITAKVDGISKSCEVIVQKPEIILSSSELYLKTGASALLTASVSSNNPPIWTSSRKDVVSVNSNGEITALQKGTAYIYVSEDGAKVRCKIYVTE